MTNQIPGYRLHRPSGQAVVTLCGKDFYLGLWKSKASMLEYDRLIAEWIANGRQLPQAIEQGSLTVVELLAAYLRFAKTYYSINGEPSSEYIAMKDAVRDLRELYGRSAIRDFGPLALKGVRQRMIDRCWARKYINQQINRIRRVFKWGVENELIPAPTLHAIQSVAPLKFGRTSAHEKDPIKPVPIEHVELMLPYASRQVAAMIQLQLLSGMRPGEVVRMRPCDIDRTHDVWIYRPTRHKTSWRGHNREIFLGPKAQDVLRPWLLRETNIYCFSPAEAEAERNNMRRQKRVTPMTPSQAQRTSKAKPKRAKRDHYDRDSYRRAIGYAIKKAGSPAWHPNQLRHTCGTEIRRTHGLDNAQLILGHKSADVTQVYAEADRAKAMQVIFQAG